MTVKVRKAVPKIVSFKIAKAPRHGVTVYAKVRSRSRRNVIHTVTLAKSGSRTISRCSCEVASFNRRRRCEHRNVVINRLARRMRGAS